MIYFYYGENNFEIKRHLSLVKNQFAKKYGSENIAILNALETEKVLTELVSVGLFSDNRLIILEDVFANNDLVKKMPDILPLVSKETNIVVTDSSPDKRTKLYKALLQNNSKEFKKPTNINKFVLDEAKKQNLEIDNDAVDELVLYTSGDLWRISNEIIKLKMLNKKISKNDIASIIEPEPDINIFRLLDNIFSKRTEEVSGMLEQLKQSEDPNKFLALLSSQVFALSVVKFSDKPSGVISSEMKIHQFLVSKMRDIAKNTTEEQVARISRIIAETDAKLKLSNKDDGWNLVDLAIKRI